MPDDKQQSDSGNGHRPGQPNSPGLSPIDLLPKVVQKIEINLHRSGRVTGICSTDMKVTMYMIGEFLKQMGPTLRYEEPSPIVQPPKGLIIPGGN